MLADTAMELMTLVVEELTKELVLIDITPDTNTSLKYNTR
jgi:hypothetical protein